jgi:hypothetical protein
VTASSGNWFLINLVVQMRPATEALSSHFASIQKATIAGIDLEDNLGLIEAPAAERTGTRGGKSIQFNKNTARVLFGGATSR